MEKDSFESWLEQYAKQQKENNHYVGHVQVSMSLSYVLSKYQEFKKEQEEKSMCKDKK